MPWDERHITGAQLESDLQSMQKHFEGFRVSTGDAVRIRGLVKGLGYCGVVCCGALK